MLEDQWMICDDCSFRYTKSLVGVTVEELDRGAHAVAVVYDTGAKIYVNVVQGRSVAIEFMKKLTAMISGQVEEDAE